MILRLHYLPLDWLAVIFWFFCTDNIYLIHAELVTMLLESQACLRIKLAAHDRLVMSLMLPLIIYLGWLSNHLLDYGAEARITGQMSHNLTFIQGAISSVETKIRESKNNISISNVLELEFGRSCKMQCAAKRWSGWQNIKHNAGKRIV